MKKSKYSDAQMRIFQVSFRKPPGAVHNVKAIRETDSAMDFVHWEKLEPGRMRRRTIECPAQDVRDHDNSCPQSLPTGCYRCRSTDVLHRGESFVPTQRSRGLSIPPPHGYTHPRLFS